MAPDVVIRRAASQRDYRACQAAQRSAWGIVDDSYLVPVATMVGAQLHGGLVLGAFLPDGSAAGLSFAFLGRSGGRLCLYSQLTGVIPGYQSLGLGVRLKQAQRGFARDEGIPVVAWAFDPFQAGNARFNLEKLGASAGRFVEDMYGPRTDALNAGVPTDRLIVEWEIDPRPQPQMPEFAADAMPWLLADSGDEPRMDRGALADPWIRLEIPASLSTLQADDARLATAWRMAARGAFSAAFSAGYRAVGFVRGERCFYVLHRVGRPES